VPYIEGGGVRTFARRAGTLTGAIEINNLRKVTEDQVALGSPETPPDVVEF
jgi:hypothetical protein